VKSREAANIGDIREEDWKPRGCLPYSVDKRPAYVYETKEWVKKEYSGDMFDELKKGSFMVTGIPGCGKSHLLNRLAVGSEKYAILSYTNKAVDVQRKKLEGKEKNKCSTFNSYFFDPNRKTINLKYISDKIVAKKIKTIYVDEFSTTQANFMILISKLKENLGIMVRLFGDTNQCLPVEKRNKSYDYDRCELVNSCVIFENM